MRQKKETRTKADLSKPLNIEAVATDDGTCFGKEWDMADRECQYCADNEVCGILFSKQLKTTVKAIEEKNPTFLDYSDFDSLDEDTVISKINGMTSQELFDFIKTNANTEDDVAVVEWIKRLVKSRENVSIKNGVVCVV